MSIANNLNSVLLEGYIKDLEHGQDLTSFWCKSRQITRDKKGKLAELFHTIKIRVFSDKLREACHKFGKDDQGIRIVGALRSGDDLSVWIEAEHIEFRQE